MPIYLPAPTPRNGGPDGQGWTRVSVASMGGLASDQCALQPRDLTHFWESLDTRRARYGGYGTCTVAGRCNDCPVLRRPPRTLDALEDRVLVRVDHPDGRPYLMNRAEDGWASLATRWTWSELASISGWEIGRTFRDEHGRCFWLTRCDS
jgi:hypothetical protein